jgi:excisionase family DNA binding protein
MARRTKVQPASPPEQLHDIYDTGERLSVSESTIRRMVAHREIGHVRVGGRLMFSDSDIAAFIERNRTPAVA